MASASMMKLVLLAAIIAMVQSIGFRETCGGEGYPSLPCDAGLACYRRSKWYYSCQPSCPLNEGWECEPLKALGWDQCSGQGWGATRVCAAGYTCYTLSIYYSQCRPTGNCPAGWNCAPLLPVTPALATLPTAAPTPAPYTGAPTAAPPVVVIAAYNQCNLPNTICAAGTGCFRNTLNYSECRPSCPSTAWLCATDVIRAGEQCGGEGYYGITRCADGLRCFARSQYYSLCAATCPGAGWVC